MKTTVLRTFVHTVKSSKRIKVTNKQNLEHFKMINQRLFNHKFCSNLKMLLSSLWAIFIQALVFAFSFASASLFRCLLILVLVSILFFHSTFAL